MYLLYVCDEQTIEYSFLSADINGNSNLLYILFEKRKGGAIRMQLLNMVEHDSKECIRISQYKYNNKIKYKNGNEPKIE